jgi:hypothetical protein
MKNSPGALELISDRVDELEKRVRALEHPAETVLRAQPDGPKPGSAVGPGAAVDTGSVFPVMGRALLGIAGAYVLRAIAESGVLPRLPLSALAVAYAFGWLLWSTRATSNMARVVYAGTAALILAPTLWENTLAFQVFAPMGTAGVLAAFLTLATVLELRTGEQRGMWIAQSIALLVTAALGFATLHGLPFITTLLLALCVCEYARSNDWSQPVWPLMALVADAAISGLMFIYSGPPGTRVMYPALSTAALIAPAVILFGINATSVVVRVVAHHHRIMIFDVIQLVIAFALAVAAVLTFAPAHGVTAMGIVCLMLSAGGYVCTLQYLRDREEQRSFRVFNVWSAGLLVAGAFWALPSPGATTLLGAAGVAATYLSRRTEQKIGPTAEMLNLHGATFLLCAAAMSGLPRHFYGSLAGTPPPYPSLAVVIVSICAPASVALERHAPGAFWQRVVHLTVALTAICAFTALLVAGVLAGAGSIMALEAHHVAFLRTLAICVVALAIAFTGSRWARPDLSVLAWTALAALGVKLLFEDLRQGHMGFAAASIALFAITLMSVPRLLRLGSARRTVAKMETENLKKPQIPV